MLDQFSQWDYVGIFGNADINMKKDWREVLQGKVVAAHASSESDKYNADLKMCLKNNILQVEILYSTIGFEQNPQNYIVGVQLSL